MRRAPVTIERIERALDEIALAIHMAGDQGAAYIPLYDRLEREMADRRSKLDTLASARARFERIAAH